MIDSDGRSFDRLGRQEPHQLNALSFVRAIPGLKEQLRVVPQGITARTRRGQRVSCPCGVDSDLEYLDVTTCDCGHVFINGGGEHALSPTIHLTGAPA